MIDYEALKEPFEEKQIRWRLGSTNAKKNGGKATSGIPLAYLDARDVMNRLDDVLGMGNWMDSYDEGANRVICTLSVKIDGQWVSKADGAGNTNMEGEKGGLSDAFKRAAVKWGVGRYLYYLPNKWVDVGDYNKFDAPKLPDWAKPGLKTRYYRYGIALDKHFDSLNEIKKMLAADQTEEALEALNEIPEDDQVSLWIAISKGGPFTPQERAQLQGLKEAA